MALISLFDRPETITRTTSQGYIDDDENFIAGDTTTIPIECNIHPYREGLNSFNNPTGYRVIDAIKVYTPSDLQAQDDVLKVVGDTLVYEGNQYFCKDLERWKPQTQNSLSLIPEHNLGYFYRRDAI